MGQSDGWMETVQATEANICINDLRGEDKEGTYKVINTKEAPLEKPFYNEFELIKKIKALVKKEGNDFELGGEIRKMFT